jgi:hypothetical protein
MPSKTANGAETKLAQSDLVPLHGVEDTYTIELQLRGVRPLLFNKFANLEGYAEEPSAPKRKPRERELRDYEAMIWRNDEGELALPCENVIASIVGGARYFRSPISNNGSARNTLQEGLVPVSEFGSFGVSEWDCIDFRLCRNSDIKRSPKPTWRPRLEKGWLLTASVGVTAPELYGPANIAEIVTRAGVAVGLGDGRRIGMGRFVLAGLEVSEGIPW